MIAIGLIASMVILAVYSPIANAVEESTQGTWSTMTPMPTARSGLGVVAVLGKIYAIGGSNDLQVLGTTEEYNPATNNWTTRTSMPTPRNGFAIAVYQNKIYVFGGSTGTGPAFTANTEVYDPVTNTWEQKRSMSIPRADLSACVVGDKIYLIGGRNYTSTSPYYCQTNINEVYDPQTDTWSRETNIPIAVQGYAAAVMNDKIYIMGGVREGKSGSSEILNYNQVYNPQTQNWSTAANLPTINSYAGCAVTSGNMAPAKIHLVGGCTATGFENKTQTYDPETNTWSTDAEMPSERAYFGLAMSNDVLYALGGFNGEKCLATNEKFSPAGYGEVAPRIEILTPENKTYQEVSISYITSRSTDWVGYRLDNGPMVTITGETALHNIESGPHSIRVYANDSLGNMGVSNTVYFTIDTQGPRITIFSPLNITYNSANVQVTFTVNENSTWTYSLDGKEPVPIIGNITLPGMPQGQHHLTVYAIDELGNTSEQTIYFTIYAFPVFWIVGITAIITIILAGSYLALKRKK
jgi:N-acetylneuraminic acid mutarotase